MPLRARTTLDLAFSHPSLVLAHPHESFVCLLTYTVLISSETPASSSNGTYLLEVSILNPRSEKPVSWTHLWAASFAYGLEMLVYTCAIIFKTKTIDNGPGVVANDEQQGGNCAPILLQARKWFLTPSLSNGFEICLDRNVRTDV